MSEKIHIRLVGRDLGAEYYEMNMAGAPSRWRSYISKIAIDSGHRWRILAQDCGHYRKCVPLNN